MNTSVYSFPNDERTHLAYGSLAQDVWHSVEIESRPNDYTVYINETLFCTENDNPEPTSNLVFAIWGGITAYVDDLTIIRNN